MCFFIFIVRAYSIISKVIDIIPKVISLYHVKDTLNIFWEKMIRIKESKYYEEIPIVEELFLKCIKTETKDKKKYDKNRLVDFLSDRDNIKNLRDNISRDVVLYREIAYINELFSSTKNIAKNIETLHQLIEHDLTRIYRVRNLLVHSGDQIRINIDIFTIRLNKYINSLLGTLIHYIKRQPDLSIPEVLNSIYETYEWYIDWLKKNSNVDIRIASLPPYLYL